MFVWLPLFILSLVSACLVALLFEEHAFFSSLLLSLISLLARECHVDMPYHAEGRPVEGRLYRTQVDNGGGR